MQRIEECLKKEHREAEKKLQQILDSKSDKEKKQLFNEVSKEILEHIGAEEEIYYSTVQKEEDMDSEVEESKEEHHVAKNLIRELDSTSVDSPKWIAKIKVLKESLEHHHEEEEDDFFTKTKNDIDSEDAKRMTSEFESAKVNYA